MIIFSEKYVIFEQRLELPCEGLGEKSVSGRGNSKHGGSVWEQVWLVQGTVKRTGEHYRVRKVENDGRCGQKGWGGDPYVTYWSVLGLCFSPNEKERFLLKWHKNCFFFKKKKTFSLIVSWK